MRYVFQFDGQKHLIRFSNIANHNPYKHMGVHTSMKLFDTTLFNLTMYDMIFVGETFTAS